MGKFCGKSALRATLAMLVLAIVQLSEGGTYGFEFSGGLVTVTVPIGGPWTAPYSGTGGSWGGQGNVDSPEGAGTATIDCSGEISCTVSWNSGGSPADVPPSTIVVEESAWASWSGESGNCANGLGSPVDTTPTSGSVSANGTR
jgi:hypothetical protein